MLLVEKTSAVSKVTSVIFRANQQGFNEKTFVLLVTQVQVNPTSPCKPYASGVKVHPNKSEVRQQDIDVNKDIFFFRANNFTHTYLRVSASSLRYVHIYLCIKQNYRLLTCVNI